MHTLPSIIDIHLLLALNKYHSGVIVRDQWVEHEDHGSDPAAVVG